MDGYKLGVVETRFAELIWQHEPLTSGELVKLCEQELQWKKSTTYTVLKKLCEHGIFQNENGTVTSLLSQEDYNAVQSEKFVEDTFDGSLPAFLAAFTTRKALSEKDIAEALKSEHFRKLAGAGRAGTAPDIKARPQVGECPALGHRRAALDAAIFR